MGPHGSRITSCTRHALVCILFARVRLYTNESAMVCTLSARYNSPMVTLFRTLKRSWYYSMFCVGFRQLSTSTSSSCVANWSPYMPLMCGIVCDLGKCCLFARCC